MNALIYRLQAVFLTLFISGCLTPITEMTVSEIASQGAIDSSPFSDIITIQSITIQNSKYHGGLSLSDTEFYSIRSFKPKAGSGVSEISHQAYVSISYYGDWRYYLSVNKLGGQRMEIDVLDRDVLSCTSSSFGCSFMETFVIPLSSEDFGQMKLNGFTFRANSQYSNRFNDIYIPATVFQAQEMLIAGS